MLSLTSKNHGRSASRGCWQPSSTADLHSICATYSHVIAENVDKTSSLVIMGDFLGWIYQGSFYNSRFAASLVCLVFGRSACKLSC